MDICSKYNINFCDWPIEKKNYDLQISKNTANNMELDSSNNVYGLHLINT